MRSKGWRPGLGRPQSHGPRSYPGGDLIGASSPGELNATVPCSLRPMLIKSRVPRHALQRIYHITR